MRRNILWAAASPIFALAAILTLSFATASSVSAQKTDPYLARAKKILRTTPLIDGHNDLPWRIREDSIARGDVDKYDLRGRAHQRACARKELYCGAGHTDLPRLREGMIGAQFWSVYTPGDWRDSGYAKIQLQQIDIARRVIAKYPDRLALALGPDDIRRIFRQRKIASLLGLEGGHAIENSLSLLRDYYALGVRYMTLTHNVTLDWADAALDSAKHNGLTPFGDSVVLEMNRLGMLVDLSHVSPATMSAALNVSRAPVIFSHSGARALVDVPRNIPDSILARVPANGGVVMVPFVTGFISAEVAAFERAESAALRETRKQFGADTAAYRKAAADWATAHPRPKATLAQAADQIEYVRKIVGADHVGIGGDFDGIDEVPVGLEDVSTYPNLFAELARRGWSDGDLRKLAGENLLRAFKQAERVSRELSRK